MRYVKPGTAAAGSFSILQINQFRILLVSRELQEQVISFNATEKSQRITSETFRFSVRLKRVKAKRHPVHGQLRDN